MSRGPTNVRSSLASRNSAFVLPAIFSLLGLVGVTTPTALGLGSARSAVQTARLQGAELRALEQRLGALRSVNGPARARLVVQRIDQLLPTVITPPEAHGVLRMVSQANGIKISVLDVGDDQDLGLVGPEQRIVALPIQLGGQGTLAGVLHAIDDLRAHGYPTAVMGFRIDRPGTATDRYQFLATLGLLHSVDNERWEASHGAWSQQ